MRNKPKKISRGEPILETEAHYYIKLISTKNFHFRSQISPSSPHKQNRIGGNGTIRRAQ